MPPVPATTTATRPNGHATSRRTGTLALLAIAVPAAVLIFTPVWADPFHRTLGSAFHTNDPMQTMWFLKWVPWQLAHHHDPLTTHAIYYPDGVSLSWNTVMPTLGVLAAPLTYTVGPAFTFALLMTAAPALTSLTGFWWLRRHCRHTAPAIVGGLVVGFNPFIGGHLLGHLNLAFTALIPLMLMLVEDLLWRRPRPQRRTAVYLGLVTAAQAGISEELILITLIGALFALGASAVVSPAEVRAAVGSSWRYLAGAIAIFLLAGSPLLVHQLFASRRVPLAAAVWRANVGDYLAPIGRQLFDPGWQHTTRLGQAEDGVYLGPMLIATLVVAVVVTVRRDRWVRVAATAMAGLVVLTFGDARVFGVPMPWRLAEHLPVLESILPARFGFASFLALAWLVARWLDALAGTAVIGARRERVSSVLAACAVVVAVATIAPAQVGAVALPARVPFFTSATMRQMLPTGSPVLLLPVPTFHDASGMYYQLQADFWFSQPGGYALRPDGSQGVSYGPSNSALVQLSATANNGSSDFATIDVAAGRQQLGAQRYRAVIVVPSEPHGRELIALAELLTGRPADRATGGVLIWLLTPGG